MKTRNLLFLIACALCFISCNDVEELIPTEGSRQISFHMQALNYGEQTPLLAQTRAESGLAKPESLLCVDVMDGVIKNVSETSWSAAPLLLDLEFGNHTLYFVAAKNKYATFDQSKLTAKWDGSGANKLNIVWAETVQLEVKRETLTDQSVGLKLVVAQLVLKIKDAIPQNVGSFTTSGSDLSWTLDLTTMNGISEGVTNKLEAGTVIGKTNEEIKTYTFVPASKKVGAVTFQAHTNENELIKEYTVTDVQVEKGYRSIYSGWFFNNSGGFTFTYDTEWKGEYNFNF
jgi:hypothetical protein